VTSDEEPGPGAPITGLSHVQLLVSDIAASARWYRTVLGLVPYAESPDIGYVALKHREARLVVVLTQGPSPSCRVTGPAGEVLDHLAFAASDGASLTHWAEHLSEQGIDHAGVVLENGHPSLQLRDPDGVAIELVAP
jgi:glyoxylase I family protein